MMDREPGERHNAVCQKGGVREQSVGDAYAVKSFREVRTLSSEKSAWNTLLGRSFRSEFRAEGPLDNIVAGVAWLRQNAGLLRGKVVEPAVRNMDAKEQQELLERIQDTDEEEKYPLLFTFDFQEDMEVFHNMAAEEDLRVNAMFLGRWVDSQ
ncbi:unnamed protein product [Boreogadus saida]